MTDAAEAGRQDPGRARHQIQVDELIADLITRDEEELLAQLGATELGETLGVRPSDFGRYVRLGRAVMDQHTRDLRATICGHPNVTNLRAFAHTEDAVEVATVADVLLGVMGHVPATIVAILVVRRGLDQLCGPLPGSDGTATS